MIWGIINVFLDAIDEITRQKALNLSPNMNKALYNLLGFLGGLIFVFILIIFNLIDYSELQIFSQNIIIPILILALVLVNIVISPLWQIVYKREKISAIIPYQKIGSLLIIIVSFFWLGGVSRFSFIVTIFLLILLVLSGIDFKNFSSPSKKGLIFLVQGLEFMDSMITIYLVKLISEVLYFASYTVLGFICISILLIFYYGIKVFTPVKEQSASFYKYRFASAFAGYGGWLISLFLITNLGPIITMLLGFLGLGATLLMSYLVQKDIPEKKDAILAIVVTVLVGLAYYFK